MTTPSQKRSTYSIQSVHIVQLKERWRAPSIYSHALHIGANDMLSFIDASTTNHAANRTRCYASVKYDTYVNAIYTTLNSDATTHAIKLNIVRVYSVKNNNQHIFNFNNPQINMFPFVSILCGHTRPLWFLARAHRSPPPTTPTVINRG